MDDYIYYIDFNSIKLGDLANSLGDFKCAFNSYSKALDRLREYQGDRIHPIMMASNLVEKIDNLRSKIGEGNHILESESWELTKSSFVKGSQCLKYIYLDKHKKYEKPPLSEEKKALFERGHEFEETVRKKEFPDGINIKDTVGNFAYFNSYTKHLLYSQCPVIIYEATIIVNDVLVMCDILKQDEDGQIDIYEIKLNTELNEAILNDLSIQHYVCKKRFGGRLKTFNVILRSDEKGENWIIKNLKNDLENRQDETEKKIEIFKETIESHEPVMQMGEQCHNPYECEFVKYCKFKC